MRTSQEFQRELSEGSKEHPLTANLHCYSNCLILQLIIGGRVHRKRLKIEEKAVLAKKIIIVHFARNSRLAGNEDFSYLLCHNRGKSVVAHISRSCREIVNSEKNLG